MNSKVRASAANDAEAILDCLAKAFEPYRASYTPAGFRDTVLDSATIGQRMSEMTLLVAVSATGDVIGTIGCQAIGDGEGHLRGMAVLPEWQGTGAAEQLLASAEAELRARKCDRVSLDTTAPLLRAVGFYVKHGYRASGRVSDFFGMPLYEYVKPLD